MAAGEIEVVIRGGAGDGAYSAAHAAAQALVAEGAYVDLRSISRMDAPEPGALRGARVRVTMDDDGPFVNCDGRAGKAVEAAKPASSDSGLARAAKVLIGVVLLQRSEGGALGIGSSSGGFMSGRAQANVLTRATARRQGAAPRP